MPHLITPFQNIPLARCRDRLAASHQALATRARQALNQALDLGDKGWGGRMKRLVVVIDDDNARPVDLYAGRHNLVEVVNQCATIERLLDAMNWALSQDGMADATVAICHATTSSGENENDLMLVLADGTLANFEVSDVVGASDGNGKEAKDLASLKRTHGSASTRSFLVTSKELGQRLARRHRLVSNAGETCVLEVGSL
jgi:hypothetical protein